ncbi:LamG domain-containing protein [Wenzhouxiangella sp. XN24]|uniref:LamG domain-containing protein n=1 Tax=Wenzhouxiangella sp. XN24 TaxID=2713569 RepID=UPI0013ED613F|nr:LamG domain-containing protein [Wenzhouxiangella sp. XN24]NGX16323.1 LamG domain-containing protein [Wenzhouxiangella sp. XN24]
MRKYIPFAAALGLLAFVHAGTAIAQSCEAYFPFDGSLADASGNGFDGRMLGQDGAAATPRFVEGRSGQALAFDGTSAMRVLMDLHYEGCPQVSFTAWIRFDGPLPKGNQVILATGGSGPGLRAAGSTLSLNGTANGLSARSAVSRDSGWMFVAGVYDYANNTYSLHWRNRSAEGTLSQHRRPPEEAVWVGAMNDRLTNAASSIVIDDLRIFGATLRPEDIRALARDTRVVRRTGPTSTEGTALPGDQYDPARLPGDQYDPARLPGDQYDPARLPGDQYDPARLPGDQYDPARLPGDQYDPARRRGSHSAASSAGPQGLQQGIEENQPIVFGSAPEPTSGSREIVTTDVRDSLQESVDERRPIELGYESEEEGVAAAEAAAARREAEAAAAAADTAQAVVPRPTGSPRFSAIAGTSGDVQRIIDLETDFLHQIWWREQGDVPCRIGVSTADIEREAVTPTELCPALVLPGSSFRVTLQTSVISSIEVCQRDSNQRLKGIRVVGDRVNADGTVEYVPGAADQESLTNCQTWSPRVMCPSQQVATGLVVHTQERRGETEAITGLQLVCRAVTAQSN